MDVEFGQFGKFFLLFQLLLLERAGWCHKKRHPAITSTTRRTDTMTTTPDPWDQMLAALAGQAPPSPPPAAGRVHRLPDPADDPVAEQFDALEQRTTTSPLPEGPTSHGHND